MKTKIDWSKAGDLVDSYKSKLSDPNLIPRQFGSSWMRSEMERVGLVRSREIPFSEFHAVWYACLVRTGRVVELSRLERKTVCKMKYQRTSAQTIRRCITLGNPTFNTEGARVLRELIA